jgi:signal transduction histidine kinase
MMSLGRLSAGLAHEINNPASAIVRSAERLSRAIAEAEDAFSRLGAAGLAREQRGMFQRIQASCLSHDAASVFSAIEQADREDAIEAWLAARGADPHAADALAESAVSLAMLDELAAGLDPNALGAAVGALAAACRLRRMALEIERAAGRVHTLVTAIRRFSYLDQSMTPAPVDLARSLADTVVVIGGKARKKGVRVSLDVEPDLPPVLALGGELNQVWLNLIDNAIDAVSADGLVEVTARRQADTVVVRVIDNGPGVPPELHERIFDPFFTTKPVGEGTGLGLDIARRLVVRHDGVIELDSRPGRTEFRVTLPVGAIHGQARHSDG